MMMRPNLILLPLCIAVSAGATEGPSLEALMEKADFHSTIKHRGDGALLEESTAVEQARALARSRSDYGLELRPSVSDDDVGLALRIYMPDRWSKRRLHEQLTLAAQSEQLRVAALEWAQIVSVYRDFSTYRMLERQLLRIAEEQRYIEPILARADQSVEMNQLTVSDRARLYSTYLGLVNEHAKLAAKLIETKGRLKTILGAEADLEHLSTMAEIQMPSQLEIESLLRQAIHQRADIQRLAADYRSMQLAEESAKSEEGFRLKYLQPGYRIDYDDGSSGWEVSAAIILPWGTRNPDIAVYQAQQQLTLKALSEQKRMTEDKLSVLLETAKAYYALFAERNRHVQPLREQLDRDMTLMANLPFEEVRDTISIRRQLLDADLIDTESKFRMENVAIDLAEELGSM